MILGGTIVAVVLVASASASLTPETAVTVASRDVRLGEVVRTPELTLAERRMVILRMPAGASSVTLSRRTLAVLVHRTVPNLAPMGRAGSIVLRLEPPAKLEPMCFALQQKVMRDAVIGREMVAAAECTDRPAAAIRFVHGVLRATVDLAPGAYLGAVRLAHSPGVQKGEPLQVVSAVGPVRIVRSVAAMQDGQSGRRIFVRDADGRVFAAPFQRSGENE